MGYPVIARIGNLPVDIRNGKGLGGGELVGWLPLVGLVILYVSIQLILFRSQRMRQRSVKRATLITNVSSGMQLFESFLKPLRNTHTSDVGQVAEMNF
jgi:hypothetical protein